MKLITSLLLVLALTGCASRTEFGDCVGINDKQDPRLVYKLSIRNLIVGVVFFQMIAPPIYVVVDQLYCPVGVAK